MNLAESIGELEHTAPLVCSSLRLPSVGNGCFTSASQTPAVTTLNLQETDSGEQSQTNNPAKLVTACILRVEFSCTTENLNKILKKILQ